MSSNFHSTAIQEVVNNVSQIADNLNTKVSELAELALTLQQSMRAMLQPSIEKLESASNIIQSKPIVDGQIIVENLVTKIHALPSVITQVVNSISSRVSKLTHLLPTSLGLPSGLLGLPGLPGFLDSWITWIAWIPGLSAMAQSLPSTLLSSLPSSLGALPSLVSTSSFPDV